MSRPLHRGVSGGGRLSGSMDDLWTDSQMKDKTEKDDIDKIRSYRSFLSLILPFGFLFQDNLPTKNSVGENGLISDQFSPASTRKRHKLIMLFLKISLALIIVLAITGSFWWTISISTSSRGQIFHGYRRLQEQLVSDLLEIGELSSGSARFQDLEFCSDESENYVPCFNSSMNLELGFSKGEENDRHCGSSSQQNCLVLPPANYRIPLRWPTGQDVIWVSNVQITAQEVLSSGSLTKR